MVDPGGAAYNVTIIYYNIQVVRLPYIYIGTAYILYNNVMRYYDVGGDDDDDDDDDDYNNNNNNNVILK